MAKGILITYICLVTIGFASAWTQSLNFENCYTTYNAYDDKSYRITWNGNVHYSGCKMTFHGYDSSNSRDEYKICIKATKWSINNPSVSLKYYTGVFGSFLEKTYSRSSFSSPTIKWCSSQNEYVSVALTTDYAGSNQGLITLEVTAVKTYSYYNSGGTIGGVIGGIIFIGIIVVIVVVVCRRRSYLRTTTYAAPPAAGTTIITQSGSQQTGGYTTGPAAPPPYYPGANNSYPQSYQNQYAPYPAAGQTPQPVPPQKY